MSNGADDRARIVEYLEKQLIGPVAGPDEILHEEPDRRYLTGILYPQRQESYAENQPSRTAQSGSEAGIGGGEDIDDETPGQFGEETDEDPLTLAGQNRPSSVGLSFVTSSWSPVVIEIEAARYTPQGSPRAWHRHPVALTGVDAIHLDPPGSEARRVRARQMILDGAASVDVMWRRHGVGAIVTVSLVNRATASTRAEEAEGCLLQVAMRCSPADGVIRRYPNARHLRTDEESEELDLLYRGVPTYAVGHGAAAVWSDTAEGGAASEQVMISFLPTHVVPGISFEVPGHTNVLDLALLKEIETRTTEIIAELDAFVDSYDGWVEGLRDRLGRDVEPDLRRAGARVLGRIDEARGRMRAGVRLLETDPTVRRAFALANEAMQRQIVHRRPELAGRPHPPSRPPAVDPEYVAGQCFWRPFQLGFLLLTLEGAWTDHPDRDVVDLIWFPTGGGKTEAYLALTAFMIMIRRLRDGDRGASTTVITRYTLRLLTTQQFQRAATLICACEILRQENEQELGGIPISIGLWVGGGNSPNTYRDARALLRKLTAGEQTEQSFQIESCPWCGTRIVPGDDTDDRLWAIRLTNNSFEVFCLNKACPFRNSLPLSSVDEDLYTNPPTFLVGTVDKFARAAWDERAGVFFGSGSAPGPSLVIQDEFHLISGPLGTIVGIYEAAFDVLLAHRGTRPKFVASTATIRRAEEQTLGVFGRRVALFPPAGLDAADSYFVRTDHDAPGRLYAGVMPQGHTPLTGLVHLSAALLQAPMELSLAPSAQDAYWTLVAYHNSLRELGKTITLAHDDIPARVEVIAADPGRRRSLGDDDIVELTSNIPAGQIPKVLEKLGRSRGEDGVSLAASTNMLSVGVDVSRLGLMVVVGQPKTTAEYIQASSRVGRDPKRPGLVVTLYSPSKPRDRSHYESFVSDHSMLYRSVEPTSVTPFSVPARSRALHADLVILARHARGWSGESAAAEFDPKDPVMAELIERLLARARIADPSEAAKTEDHLWRLAEEWSRRTATDRDTAGLCYSPSTQRPSLLRRFGTRGEGWPTLDSMRSVDVTVDIRVRGAGR